MAGRDNDLPTERPSPVWKWSSSFSASTGASASASTSSATDAITDANTSANTDYYYTRARPDSATAAVSRFDGGGPADQNMALVALSSSYSPLALRSLRQPVPNDAPGAVDSSIFTFEDAFEDLLAASKGQSLPDIHSRYAQRRMLRSMFPDGHEPAWFWLSRLRSQELLDMPTLGSLGRMISNSNWDFFHRELDRVASDVWRGGWREERDNEFREFPGDHRRTGSGSDIARQRNREPDNFDDFFSSFESASSSAQSSWDTFVKSFNSESDNVSSLNKVQNNSNQEVVKDEYVDRWGYLHSKVTVKTLDDDGNQIGSQTHYTVRPSDKKDGAEAAQDDDHKGGSGVNVNGRLESKSSWFWK